MMLSEKYEQMNQTLVHEQQVKRLLAESIRERTSALPKPKFSFWFCARCPFCNEKLSWWNWQPRAPYSSEADINVYECSCGYASTTVYQG